MIQSDFERLRRYADSALLGFNGELKGTLLKIQLHTLSAHWNPHSLIKIALFAAFSPLKAHRYRLKMRCKYGSPSSSCNEQNIENIIAKCLLQIQLKNRSFRFAINRIESYSIELNTEKVLYNTLPWNRHRYRFSMPHRKYFANKMLAVTPKLFQSN